MSISVLASVLGTDTLDAGRVKLNNNIETLRVGINSLETTVTGLTATDVGAIASSEKGVANGVATLDSNGLLPHSQLSLTAADISIADANNHYTATNVESALAEIATSTSLGSLSNVDLSTTFPAVGNLLAWDGTNWIPQGGRVISKTAAYTLAETDNGNIIECNGTFTITLPAGLSDGFQVALVNTGTGTITLAGDGTSTVNAKALTLSNQWGAATAYRKTGDVYVAFGDLS